MLINYLDSEQGLLISRPADSGVCCPVAEDKLKGLEHRVFGSDSNYQKYNLFIYMSQSKKCHVKSLTLKIF